MSAAPFYLVQCAKEKAAGPCRARLLYRGDWFTKARAFVESTGHEWRILSAEYGVVHPDRVIDTYDKCVRDMGRESRDAWGIMCAGMLHNLLHAHTGPVVFLAGLHYREAILVRPATRSSNAGPRNYPFVARATVPMDGLGIGQQKAWLKAQTQLMEVARG